MKLYRINSTEPYMAEYFYFSKNVQSAAKQHLKKNNNLRRYNNFSIEGHNISPLSDEEQNYVNYKITYTAKYEKEDVYNVWEYEVKKGLVFKEYPA